MIEVSTIMAPAAQIHGGARLPNRASSLLRKTIRGSCRTSHGRRNMRAYDIMTKDVLTVTADMSVDEVRDRFFHNRIHGAPVVDTSGTLIGIVSFVDLAGGLGRRVLHVMQRDPVTASEDASVEALASLMLAHKIHRIPIVHDRRLVGIVAASDIIQALLDLRGASGAETAEAEEKV
ncbi:MAG TPA: hypothetical protein DEP35_04240 [Deltaproteobacteria bacterium]|jgi:CBS domain-containing protein|nr:hypothetical protein [Deltaproteobacteria bacterium]